MGTGYLGQIIMFFGKISPVRSKANDQDQRLKGSISISGGSSDRVVPKKIFL